MEIIRHIKVDLYGDTQHFAVAAKQMDMGTRYIGVTLMEDGVVYEIPDNVEVIINMTKPDKTHVHNDGEKSGNEALIPLTRGMLQVHDFNPRSREGSDTIWSDIVSRTGISIRAPARGATTERSYLLDMDVISIRAPARGATRAISPGQLYCKHFNPRSREGSDAALPPAFPLPCEFQSALPRGERLHKLRKLLL